MIINQPKEYPSQYRLTKENKELLFHVNQTGGNVWAEFIVELYPKEQTQIEITLIDKSEKYKNYYDIFEQGISQSIFTTLTKLNSRGIGLSGFDMTITNLSYLPVDSKPVAYRILFEEMISRLFNTSYFQMEVNPNSLNSPFYNIKTLPYDKIKDPYLLNEIHHSLVSPKRFVNTIVLNERVEILIYDLDKKVSRWKISLSPKIHSHNVIYSTDIEFRDKYEKNRKYKTISTIIKITDQLKKLCNELARKHFNISGFYLLIEPLYNSEEEPFVKSNIEYLKWPIFNVLLDDNITEIRRENL